MRYWLLPRVTWLTDDMLRRMAVAYALVGAECAAAWGKPAPEVAVASSEKDIPDTDSPIVFGATIDIPGDLAYHEWLGGRPFSLVLAVEGTWRDTCIGGSHELPEADIDPGCNQYRPLPSGSQIALEVADPVESDSRDIDTGSGDPVPVSNYVLPAWFDPEATPGAKLDAMGLCDTPLVVRPGGYAIVVDPNGSTRQIGAGPAAYKRHPAFRYGRRLAHAHGLAMRIRGAA